MSTEDDEEATRIVAKTLQDPLGDAAPSAHDVGNTLPIGTRLAEFEITQVLGEGGFGIVYLARDHSLGRRVALKEYMPSALAARHAGQHVSVKSERHRETFQAGLKSFINEARLLAQFDHPSLVKVYRFWEANGTAYMVMPFYEGITLKDTLKATGRPPDEVWIRELLEPLMEALAVIHAEQCFHRDIAPDNVILLKGSDLPLLLDFGAARRVIGDMTQALTVILKPGYAPVEQYAEVPGMKQGGWTDVYALAAVVYYAIVGKTPPTSVARLMNDTYVPLAQLGAGRYSPGFLAAIDRALRVRPEDRTQSIEAFRHELGMSGEALVEAVKTQRRARAVAAATQPAPLTSPSAPSRAGAHSRAPLLVATAVLVLLGAAAGVYLVMPGAQPSPPAVAVQPPVDAGVPASAAVATGEKDVKPPLTDASAVSAAGAAAKLEFSAEREFARVSAAQSPDYAVEAAADKPRLRIQKDKMTFKVKSAKEGHLYVLMHGTDGALVQIYPNAVARNNRIRAGSTLALPPAQGDWDIGVAGPPGTDHLLAIVSKHPRDFQALGFKVRDGFAQTTVAAAKLAAERHAGATSIFAGTPICPDACNDDYGAAVFTVEEVD
jgi:hypothetical protein